MSITIKTPREIELMREAGRILAEVHNELGKIIEPGITTLEIDKMGEKLIRSYGCEPSFLNYQGYPASICVSINDEVIHGIPGSRKLLEGDLVSIDIVVDKDGYFADATRSFVVGKNEKSYLCRINWNDCAIWCQYIPKNDNYILLKITIL